MLEQRGKCLILSKNQNKILKNNVFVVAESHVVIFNNNIDTHLII